MSYVYDKAVEALGESKLLGRRDMEYGKWTPNGVRSLGVFRDVIVVEYHPPYNNGRLAVVPMRVPEVIKDIQLGERMKSPLDALNHKKFMTLEEVIVDSMLPVDVMRFLNRSVDPKARLRQVSVVNWSEAMSKAYVSRLPGYRQKDSNSLIVKGLSMQVVSSVAGPGEKDWFARFSLTSNVYKSDLNGEALDRYFRHVAGKHGVSQMEAVDVEELTEREVLNIRQHRQNVKCDIAGAEQLEIVMSEILLLKKGKESPRADKRSATELHRRLVKAVKRGSSPVRGLRYYVETYGEEDSIPEQLIERYQSLGYLDDTGRVSGAVVEEANGYFDYQEGIVRAVRAVYKDRQKRKLYVPDADRYVPSIGNLGEFVSLVLSEEFDYIGYSAELEAISQNSEEVELAEKIRRRLEQAESSDKEQVSDTARVIRKSMSEEKDSANAEFFRRVRDGAVSAGRDVYISHVSKGLSDAVNKNFSWLSGLLLGGLKAYVAKGKPWGFLLEPVIDAVGRVGGDQLLEAVNQLLDELDQWVEGERSEGGELTEERRQALTGLFEEQMYWGYGMNLLARFMIDVSEFSQLKKRQVGRIARSKTGIVGLERFLEENKALMDHQEALEMYKTWGYTGEVSGVSDTISLEQNMLLTPREFYLLVFQNFNKLSNKQADKANKVVNSAPGPESLAELDSLCRDSIGLPSRAYGEYVPKTRETIEG